MSIDDTADAFTADGAATLSEPAFIARPPSSLAEESLAPSLMLRGPMPGRRPRGPIAPGPSRATVPAQLSRRKGWYRYAWGAHAFPTTVTAVFLGPYLTDIARNAAGGENHYLHLAGVSVRAESFYPFAVTAAALLQAAILPLVGAAADRSGRTRTLLSAAMGLGVVATLLFYTVSGGAYLWGGALFLAASLGYSTANVLANGYLPTLADARRARRDQLQGLGRGLPRRRGAAHRQPGASTPRTAPWACPRRTPPASPWPRPGCGGWCSAPRACAA